MKKKIHYHLLWTSIAQWMVLKPNLHSNITMAIQETILSFVNNVRTKDGGTHEVGMKGALTKAFNEYARKVGLLKEKDKTLEGSDVREGLTAIISLRIPEEILQFEGQNER